MIKDNLKAPLCPVWVAPEYPHPWSAQDLANPPDYTSTLLCMLFSLLCSLLCSALPPSLPSILFFCRERLVQ